MKPGVKRQQSKTPESVKKEVKGCMDEQDRLHRFKEDFKVWYINESGQQYMPFQKIIQWITQWTQCNGQ